MVISEIATLFFYVVSIAFLPEYFGAFAGSNHIRHQLLLIPILIIFFNRSLFRDISQVRMESCSYRRDKCVPVECYQAD